MGFFRSSKSLFAVSLILSMSQVTAATSTTTKGLRDVPKSHWANPAVTKLVEEYHFMQGDPNGNFGGSRAISRYEFARTMSNIVDHYNTELEADRKDLANVVEVMELFQKELKTLEGKIAEADKYVQSQNQTVGELNELVVGLSDSLNTGSTRVVAPGASPQSAIKPNVDARLTELEKKVESINDRGLVVGTILRGVAGDMRHLTKAAGKVVTGGRAWRKPKEVNQEKVNIFQFVDANVKVNPENANSGGPNPETSTSPSVNPEPSSPESGLH